MNKLLKNELLKLFLKKPTYLYLALVLLVPVLAAGTVLSRDNRERVRWQDVYQDEVNEYAGKLSRYSEYSGELWASELDYRADVLQWENDMQKLQFCLDNQISDWDWRQELIDRYFRNRLLQEGVRNGWNSQELAHYFGFSTLLDLGRVEEENNTLMRYILANDYTDYCRENLAEAEDALIDLRESVWLEDAERQIALAENDVWLWETYLKYALAPGSRDSWKSIAVRRIYEDRMQIILYDHPTEDEAAYAEEHKAETSARRAECEDRVARDLFSLEGNLPTESLMKEVYTEKSTFLHFADTMFEFAKILIVIGIILAASLVGMEYKYRTIQQMVQYPYKRSKALRAKFTAVNLVLVASAVVMAIVQVILGRTLFPAEYGVPVFSTAVNGTVYWVPYAVYVAARYALILLTAFVMVSFTVMVAVISRSSAVAGFFGLVGYLVVPYLLARSSEYLSHPAVFKYMFFGSLDLTPYLLNRSEIPFIPFWISVIFLLGGWFLFRRIAYAVYSRSEIREE